MFVESSWSEDRFLFLHVFCDTEQENLQKKDTNKGEAP